MQSAIRYLIAIVVIAAFLASAAIALGLSHLHKAKVKGALDSCCNALTMSIAEQTDVAGLRQDVFLLSASQPSAVLPENLAQELISLANPDLTDTQSVQVESNSYWLKPVPGREPGTFIVAKDTFFYDGMVRSWALLSMLVGGIMVIAGVLIYRIMAETDEYITHLKDGALFTWNNFRGIALKLSEKGRILDANQYAQQRLPNCIGQRLVDLMPAHGCPDIDDQLELALQQNAAVTFECLLQESNGQKSCWVVQLQQWKNHRQRGVGILLTADDVTHSTSLKEQLEKEKDRLLTYLDAMQTLLIVCDPDTRVLHANQSALTLLERSHHKLIGEPLIQQISPAQQGSFRHYWEQLQTRPAGHMAAEFSLLTASDQERTISWRLNRIDGEEQPHFLLAGLDVTETTANRQALKAANDRIREALAEAEYANQSKSIFLANMSHEIRTPMNGIMGATQLVLETNLNEQQRSYLDMVYQSSQALLEILNDILDLSKIESGRLELEHIPFDLADLLMDLNRLFEQPIKRKGLSLIYCYDTGLPTTWRGDPKRIRQVMTNLISNALKFTEHGRIEIRVSLAADESGFKNSGGRDAPLLLNLSVRDTGIGIASDKLDQIFTPFRQADSSTSRRFGGTGLGLTICRHLAESMGGGIRVESSPGAGSLFEFQALLEPTELSQQRSKNSAESEVRFHGNVLLAEDNEVNQTIAARMLARIGLVCTVAADGYQALSALENGSYDLILMDVNMPRLDGLETTRRIRDRADGLSFPIIALTANAMLEDRQRCLKAGMNGFLTKPIKLEALRSAIREVAPQLQASNEAEV